MKSTVWTNIGKVKSELNTSALESGGSSASRPSLISSFAQAFARAADSNFPRILHSQTQTSFTQACCWARLFRSDWNDSDFPRAIRIARQDDAPCEAGVCGGDCGGKSFPSRYLVRNPICNSKSLYCSMITASERGLDTVAKSSTRVETKLTSGYPTGC